MTIQDGVWSLTSIENKKTRVTYRATALPKFAVPRGFTEKAMHKDVPNILNNMVAEAEKDENFSALKQPKPI